jgi:hypothetical protein
VPGSFSFAAIACAANPRIASRGRRFILGVVGCIYAVLLAFVVIVVWEQFEAAQTAVSEEATHLGNIIRLADGLPQEASARIRSEAKEYAKDVLEAEWPAMGIGDEDVLERSNADNLWVVIRDFHPPMTERM